MSGELPTVDDIIVFNTGGEWPTKSNGQLSVLFKLDFSLVDRFFTYDPAELSRIPFDIRGLRSYKVTDLQKNSVGANEWHRIRNEIVFCLSGSFTWTCVDMNGNKRVVTITKDTAIYTPHHILHTYRAVEDNSCIAVLANTLFDPDNPSTHDTYPPEDFKPY